MDVPTTDVPDTKFHENFESKLSEYESQHQGSQRKPWTDEKIYEVINNIRQAKLSTTNKQRKTSMEYYWISKYDILTIDNEDHLIFKRKFPHEPTVCIIPRKKYFNVLVDVHKSCGHGGRDKMIQAIKSKFYIPKKAIEIFLALCPTCENKKSFSKKGVVTVKRPVVSQDFNSRGQVDIIDFQSCPDGKFKWLLCYQDNSTKFVSLRPLKTKRPNEVAMELMKIFTTFGAPNILQSENGRKFTAKVIKQLTAMWPDCKIVHGSAKPPESQGSVEKSSQDVENMLRSWMGDNSSTSWSLGCYHVQFKKNASVHRTIGRSPYKALFGSDPKAGLSSSTIPSLILMNVETEEQLKNLSKQQFSDSTPDKSCNNVLENESNVAESNHCLQSIFL